MLLVEVYIGTAILEDNFAMSSKVEDNIFYNPAVLLRGVYPEPRQKFLVYKDMYKDHHWRLFLTAKLETNI